MIMLNILLQATSATQNSTEIDLKLLMTVISALSGAIIGGLITIWYKRSEIKNLSESLRLQSENLQLQKDNLKETIANNELKIKAELVRLEDLNRQYKLSLKKFDFEHLKELLEFADDKNDKVAMLKDFTIILSKFNPEIPAWVEYYDDYQQIVVDHTYYRLDDIEKDIKKILEDHVTTFASLHHNFKDVSSQATNILRQKAQFTMDYDEVSDEYVIHQLFKGLYKLYEDFNQLLELMQEEFRELDKLKRDFILGKSKKNTEE